MTDVLVADHVSKRFDVPVRVEACSLRQRIAQFIRNRTQELLAVDDVSFSVGAGDVVGLLGANGSGKSTIVKMLTGILTPSAGQIRVLGFSPHRQRRAYTQHIGVVFGQRSLLWWNIPVLESLKLYRDIYGLDRARFEARLHHFCDVLDIHPFLHVPVRKLSLGMRMRAELAASLLHQPKIIFLDEPTIGLDILGRRSLKRFLRRVNAEEGVTIVLTTHNMFDVEDLCRRCIILRGGVKVYDGDIAALKAAEQHKILEFETLEIHDPDRFGALLSRHDLLDERAGTYRLRVPGDLAVAEIQALFACARIDSLNVLAPNLESIVERLLVRDRLRATPEAADGRQMEEALCAAR